MRTQELNSPLESFVDIDQIVDIVEYLQTRNSDPNFLMIEIGHDAVPVAYQQPVPFTGNRAFIGVETWLRNSYGNKPAMVQALHDKHNGQEQNIFYINHPMSVGVMHDQDNYTYLVGDYHNYTETILPDSIASEVFISNVFCDPHIAYDRNSTKSLLAESARLTKPGGRVIVRETLTPNSVIHFNDELAQECGLRIVSKIAYEPSEKMWHMLEEIYKGDPSIMTPHPNSYFYFLERV